MLCFWIMDKLHPCHASQQNSPKLKACATVNLFCLHSCHHHGQSSYTWGPIQKARLVKTLTSEMRETIIRLCIFRWLPISASSSLLLLHHPSQILFVVLCSFANGSFLYNTGNGEHISKATVCRAIRKLCLTLKLLLQIFVVFTVHKLMRIITAEFFRIAGKWYANQFKCMINIF